MSYSDFTLKTVQEKLDLNIIAEQNLFSAVPETQISEYLATTLNYNVPLALAVGTEKARSEFIIANVLLEIRKIFNNNISLFSGVLLDVDRDRGLTGFCDFIFSYSPQQFYISAPIVTIVEAKNECIVGGLGQCVAEMYAASIFNEREGLRLPVVYGVVTTGNTWKFLKYVDKNVYIDLPEYHIGNINKIIAIFTVMVTSTT